MYRIMVVLVALLFVVAFTGAVQAAPPTPNMNIQIDIPSVAFVKAVATVGCVDGCSTSSYSFLRRIVPRGTVAKAVVSGPARVAVGVVQSRPRLFRVKPLRRTRNFVGRIFRCRGCN